MDENKKTDSTEKKSYTVKQPYGTHQIGQTIELTEEEAKALLEQGTVAVADKTEDKA